MEPKRRIRNRDDYDHHHHGDENGGERKNKKAKFVFASLCIYFKSLKRQSVQGCRITCVRLVRKRPQNCLSKEENKTKQKFDRKCVNCGSNMATFNTIVHALFQFKKEKKRHVTKSSKKEDEEKEEQTNKKVKKGQINCFPTKKTNIE